MLNCSSKKSYSRRINSGGQKFPYHSQGCVWRYYQVVKEGDVPNNNFDMQIGDGGFGRNDDSWNNRAQFDGNGSQWEGVNGGGLLNLSSLWCSPADSMQDLCRWSFDKTQ